MLVQENCWNFIGELVQITVRYHKEIQLKQRYPIWTFLSILTSLSLHMHLTNSSLEWLANEPNEKLSKRLNLRSISLRDVSLAIKDEMFTLNWFSWISNSWRDVKLYRQEGRVPSKEFPWRSNSSSFLSPHKPVKKWLDVCNFQFYYILFIRIHQILD